MPSYLRLFLALSLANAAAADPADVVRQFLLAEAGGDRAKAAALWISPDQAFSPRQWRRIEKRCSQMTALMIAVTSADESQATIETEEVIGVFGARASSAGRTETSHSRFVLKPTAAGWRIASRESIEAALVERLKNAKDAGERRQLIAGSIEFHNETFVRSSSDLIRQFVNQRHIDDAAALAILVDDIARRIGDPVAASEIASARSIVARYGQTPGSDLAIQLGEEAVEHASAADDADALTRALSRLARAKAEVDGRLDASLLERALDVADRLEDPSSAAHTAVLLAQHYERQWRRREAFRYAELASRYADASDDVSAKIIAAQMLGGAYLWTADLELARRYFERAYELALAAGYDEVAAAALTSLSTVVHGEEGNQLIERGLQRFPPEHARPLLLERITRSMGRGRADEAERDLRKYMEIAPKNATTAGDIALRFVAIRLAQQRYPEAAHHLDEARRLLKSDYDTAPFEASVLRCLGRDREAIDVLEKRFALLGSADNASIADPRAAPFTDSITVDEESLLDVHVEQGNVRRALEVAESVKAKALRHALVDGGIGAAAMTVADRQRERDLEGRIEDLNRTWMASNEDATSAALHDARNNLVDFRQRVLATAPFQKAGAGAERAGVDDLPSTLDDVTIFSYVQTDNRVMVFLAEPKTSDRRRVSARFIPISNSALQRKISHYASFMDQRNLRANELASELYTLLLAPFEKELLQARIVCIIPHRGLWRVPFHALLQKDGRSVIDTVPVFYAPSLAVLAETEMRSRRTSQSPSLLAFANPLVTNKTASLYQAFNKASLDAIPETEWEVRAIAELYEQQRTKIYVGSDATEETIKRESPHYDVVHIATHGLAQENAPMFSSLLLSPLNPDEEDGLLEAHEIVSLDLLRTDTVVLSACDTGKSARGDTRRNPVIGLSWAFLAAGSRTTVVSQWRAQSAATAKLMVAFHRQLVNGASKTEALRAAQLELRGDRRYRHPFYWAPFIVVGAP